MKKILIAVVAVTGLALIAQPAIADQTKDAVRNGARSTVKTKTGACVRTKWMGDGDPCASEPPAPPPAPRVEAPPPAPAPVPRPAPVAKTVIEKAARTIYFDSNKDTVSPGGQQKLDQLAETLKGAKDIQKVNIVGYADPMGDKKHNYDLSARRARAVEAYLNKQGYMNTSLAKVRAVGEDEASADCPKNLPKAKRVACLKTDRRVEVEVVYATTK